MIDDIEEERSEGWFRIAGSSMLRAALLFSSAGIAFALILAPLADRMTRDDSAMHGIDYSATSSVDRSVRYTIRRSVLQNAGSTCIIRADGRRSGDC